MRNSTGHHIYHSSNSFAHLQDTTQLTKCLLDKVLKIYLTSYYSMWHLRWTNEKACWGELTWRLISKALTLLSLYCSHSFPVLTLLKGKQLNLQCARHLTPIDHNTPSLLHTCPAGLRLWFQERAGKWSFQLPSIAFQWPAAAEVPFDLFLYECLRGLRSGW